MALISYDEVQVWLETSKLEVAPSDLLPEEAAASPVVLSRLAVRYDTSTWVNTATTPSLVRKIISMLVAAWRYNAYYSETSEDGGNPYANKLEERANDLIDGIVSGAISLTDVTDQGPAVEGTIDFYPTDASTAANTEDDAGIAFTMGKVF
jgi:hypothetical protein